MCKLLNKINLPRIPRSGTRLLSECYVPKICIRKPKDSIFIPKKKTRNIDNADFAIQVLLKQTNPTLKSIYLNDINDFNSLFKDGNVCVCKGRLIIIDKFGLGLSSVCLDEYVTDIWLNIKHDIINFKDAVGGTI